MFRKAVNCYRKKLCQRIELPKHVKATLRGPDDEDAWPHLEKLRESVVRCILGERSLELDEDCAAEIAASLERSRPGRCVKQYANELGPGCRYAPEGSRLLVVVKGPPRKTITESRSAIAIAVRKLVGKTVLVHTRPTGTIRSPPLGEFATALLRDAKQFTLRSIADEMALTKAGALDRVRLALWDALFLDQCEAWSQREVANLPADETPELAKWFLKGLAVGEKPISDGMCKYFLASSLPHRSRGLYQGACRRLTAAVLSESQVRNVWDLATRRRSLEHVCLHQQKKRPANRPRWCQVGGA